MVPAVPTVEGGASGGMSSSYREAAFGDMVDMTPDEQDRRPAVSGSAPAR
jgi:hypothetical protein